jgi:hypothetical protein
LTFTIKGHIYGKESDSGIIREVDVNLGASFDKLNRNIDIKPDPLTADADDDYGFTETITDI